jgi:GT2 family glycosyltransferase
MTPAYGCIVLSQGRRPEDLRLAVESLLAQRGVDVDVVVVGNAWRPTGLPPEVHTVELTDNVGIPAGRNAGVDRVHGDLLFFLDEDASLRDDDTLARIAAKFAGDPRLGLLQLHVDSRSGGPRSRDWVPRLRVGDPARSSDVCAVWEGALAIPRRVFEDVGRWSGDLRFVHEGVDLAWRVMDAGYRVHYAGDVVALHPSPVAAGAPHPYSTYYGARNRVWLARRYLPAPLGGVYVASFMVRTLPRLRAPRELRQALRGYRDGLRGSAGPRRRLSGRTLVRMTRAGRPPVV